MKALLKKQIRFVEAVRVEARLRDLQNKRQWAGHAVRLAQEIDPETIPGDPDTAGKRLVGLLYQVRILPRL